MASQKLFIFNKGVHNLLNSEMIPQEALQDARNWICEDGVLRLVNGKVKLGAEGVPGKIRGLWIGYKIDGTKVKFRKTSTKIQYYNETTALWTDIIVGLTATAEYSFQNYSSLSGAWVVVSGVDGLYRINTANLGDYIDMYSSTKNDKGRILIDKGRLFMWNCSNASKTSIKSSYIDKQNSDVYTTVTAEATISLGGTLAFKAGGVTRNCFGLVLTLTGTGEIYTDNKDGTLTGSLGGTGTINYITGVYTVSNAGVGTVNYFWEDSNEKGITDFRFTAIRVAGEGNLITQNIGGDNIERIEVGQDGAYYSLKSKSSYRLDISADDNTFTNLVYRSDLGIPYFRAAVATSKGLVFMNTSNPNDPKLTILTKNIYSDSIEPVVLFPHFNFSLYGYDDCCIDTFGRYVIVACQSAESDFNDTILLCDMITNIVDIGFYPSRVFAKDAGNLYVGSPITETVYNVFNGFDDDNFVIENFAVTKGETFKVENLKRERKLKIQGLIEPDQNCEVCISYDDVDFELLGTISGRADYVDGGTPTTVGSNMTGTIPVGGDNQTTVYPFFYEVKIHTPKFRKRELKFVALNYGYIGINSVVDDDILLFENRLPKRFRVKAI
jgi:hypothetical protein